MPFQSRKVETKPKITKTTTTSTARTKSTWKERWRIGIRRERRHRRRRLDNQPSQWRRASVVRREQKQRNHQVKRLQTFLISFLQQFFFYFLLSSADPDSPCPAWLSLFTTTAPLKPVGKHHISSVKSSKIRFYTTNDPAYNCRTNWRWC